MEICKHHDIVFVGDECPMCEMRDEHLKELCDKDNEIQDMQDDLDLMLADNKRLREILDTLKIDAKTIQEEM